MIIASMAGLISGMILAINQSYTISSLLAMIIGIGAGVIIGILFNTMTILEGIMGGVMGGLMGAMMGEMLPINSIFILSFALIMITILLFFLLTRMVKQEAGILKQFKVNGSQIKKLSILIPCVTVAIFMAIIVGSFYESNNTLNSHHIHPTHHKSE
ncbi:hypothetical protein [Alkalihalobacillus deserti]|uniref:hypothetical protein n=1 Tax=Alkalihalobacillus deserti TaxID=2879466 RepID=UPI001D1557DD|nr:hypothetical protein [Alkalihalobacillus deserti]